jgi:protein-disulfide isomerase
VAQVAPDRPRLPSAAQGGSPIVAAPAPDRTPTVDAATIDRLGLHEGPARGPADAPVTLVVFMDFKCRFCGKVLGTIDELWDEYPGKLRLVIKQLPVHATAVLAAEGALAAAAKGKFWEYHDLVLAAQSDLTPAEVEEAKKGGGMLEAPGEDLSAEALTAFAVRAGIDEAWFRAALDERRYQKAVEADMAAAQELAIRGTPAFLINGRRFVGARPIAQFRETIDAALADGR